MPSLPPVLCVGVTLGWFLISLCCDSSSGPWWWLVHWDAVSSGLNQADLCPTYSESWRHRVTANNPPCQGFWGIVANQNTVCFVSCVRWCCVNAIRKLSWESVPADCLSWCQCLTQPTQHQAQHTDAWLSSHDANVHSVLIINIALGRNLHVRG